MKGWHLRVKLLQETVQGWLEMFATNLHLSEPDRHAGHENPLGTIISFTMATADQFVAQP
jgi:hypothetical protein